MHLVALRVLHVLHHTAMKASPSASMAAGPGLKVVDGRTNLMRHRPQIWIDFDLIKVVGGKRKYEEKNEEKNEGRR